MSRREALLCLMLASQAAWCAETLPIDTGHTAVVFSWTHRGYSNPIARLEKVQGTVVLDRTDLTRSSVSAVLFLEGLRTGDESLDKRLSGKYFFDVTQHPQITFKSTEVQVVGRSNRLRIAGELSVHGISRPVVLEATINKMTMDSASKSWVGFDADTTLRRSDFDLGRYVPMVGDEITIHITLEAHAE